MEKLTGERILVALTLVTLAIASPISTYPSSSNLVMGWYNRSICLTESCTSTAISMLSGMNEKADPCENFYDFACGNWGNENPLPPGYYQWNQFTIRAIKTQLEVKDILQSPINGNDIDAVRKAKLSYQICMDEVKIDERGMEGIEAILRANGGWPLAMPAGVWNSRKAEFPWQKIHNNYMTNAGLTGLFTVEVSPDLLETNRFRIWLRKPVQFRMPKMKLILLEDNHNLMQIYSKYIWTIVHAMDDFKKANGATKPLVSSIMNMINFEMRLANITLLYESVDSTTDLMTIDELQALYNSANPWTSTSKINWLETIRSVFVDIPDIKITGQEKIRVMQKQYFLNLVNLLNETPEEIVVNYLHWKLVDKAVVHTTREMRQNLYGFLLASTGLNYARPREELCLEQTGLEHAIGYAYVQKHYSGDAKTKAQSLMKQIQKAMANQIDKSPWLDEPTKILAKEKLDYMTALIGYPDWYTPDGVNKHYEDIQVGTSFFTNTLSRWQFKLNEDRSLLRATADRKKWPVPPTKTNALYSIQINAVIIPASILQLPFYDAQRPEAVNYGSIGAIIGHEITHGFDQHGRQYDKFGNGNQWWDDEVIKKYVHQAQCFVDKFNKYKIYESSNETIYVDGTKTLAENIADAMGFQLAHAAYEQWGKEAAVDDFTLPRHETYTNDQLFFLSLANMWCSTESNEFLRTVAPSDKHSIPSLRVIGALSNMERFSKAFECPLGSTMNPVKKCGIWG